MRKSTLRKGSFTGGLERWKKLCATGADYVASYPRILANGVIHFAPVGTSEKYQAQFFAYGDVRGPDAVSGEAVEGVTVVPLAVNRYAIDKTKKLRLRFYAQKKATVGAQGHDVLVAFIAGSGNGGPGTLVYPDDYVCVNLRGGNDATLGLRLSISNDGVAILSPAPAYDTGSELGEILTTTKRLYEVRIDGTAVKIYADGVLLVDQAMTKSLASWDYVNVYFVAVALSEITQNFEVSKIILENNDTCF